VSHIVNIVVMFREVRKNMLFHMEPVVITTQKDLHTT